MMLGYFTQFLFILFVIGVGFIFLFRDNLIRVFISVELVFLSLSLFFVLFDSYSNTLDGQIFAFFILILAGVETAIALSVLLIYFRMTSRISF